MSVLVVTTVGRFVIDLNHKESPKECFNFLKLVQHRYYDWQYFYNLNQNFIVQSGKSSFIKQDTSIWGLNKEKLLLVKSEGNSIKHDKKGIVSLVSLSSQSLLIGSQFMITLTDDAKKLSDLDKKLCVIGEISEGMEVVDKLNATIVDDDKRPLEDIIILHTYVIHDPFSDQETTDFEDVVRDRSRLLTHLRVLMDDDDDDKKKKKKNTTELNSKLLALEMIGDIDSRIKPSEKVLFICKLNPITKESDLQIIFQRFGDVKNVEIIKDKMTGRSLNYGFIEFLTKELCEALYLRMDNSLIDDRRIHVDFSQSISKQRVHHRYNDRRNRYRRSHNDRHRH